MFETVSFLVGGAALLLFGQLNQLGARKVYKAVSKCHSEKVLAHGNNVTVWQAISRFPSVCISPAFEYKDGRAQQSLQWFVVCYTLIIVSSLVFLGSRCWYYFDALFPYDFCPGLKYIYIYNISTGMLGV